ncbi:S41 family peptidase [Aestuariibacter salexigens]|uniref:S41 family peptidase n=1 Tax=Aestuariibacter salexigens TaxID=226010 RepID=UPI000415A969|nr:S41 family peptidase [Aestuariibacter salexigens]
MKFLRASLLAFASMQAVAQPLILQPEISPDGDKVAFTYQGDIWTVSSSGGRANRLTIHEGYDANPAWSADGNHIAFNSDRFGNDDVYIMAADGGMPTRLTYHSANDAVTSITPDGQVLFNSRRTYAQVEREWEVLSVHSDGKRTESRFMDALGFDAAVSPDGSKVAFVRGTNRIAREAYRGPANRNIWIFDTNDGSYTQLTEFEGNDFLPRWIDNESLYFLSSRSGKYNVHKATLVGGFEQLTFETAFGVNHFSVSADGQQLVYQTGDNVYKMGSGSTDKQLLNVDVKTDFRFDPVVAKTVSDKLDEYAVSPDGKLTAYVHRGDIYVTRNDKEDKRSVRLTQGADRDRDVTWLNDNSLLFVSDRAGQNDVYLLSSSDPDEKNIFVSLKHSVTRVTDTESEEFEPVVSPDGGKVAFRQGRGKLVTASIDDAGQLTDMTTLLDGWDTPSGVSWSPDSQWLAYSLSDLNFNEEVFIHAADNSSEPVNVSMHPKRDANPVWSPDGSKLGFISSRNNSDADVWFVWLKKEDWQRSKEQWRQHEFMGKKDDKENGKDKDKDDDQKDSGVAPIEIDFDGIYERLAQVTSFATNEAEMAFTKDGEHIYYTVGGSWRQNFKAERNLYKIKWNGEDNKTVIDKDAEVERLVLTASGKHLYALSKGGKLNQIATKDDKRTALSVTSKLKVDYAAELEQLFEEGWRALNAGFYDPDFHGQDWQALKDAYKPLAMKASTKEDFQTIFNLMLGQLNASHMGMYRGENQKETQKQRTGLLGIEGLHTERGFKVQSVLADSPADREDSRLQVGDVITTVNQQPVADTNFYSLLVDSAETPVLLNLEREGNEQELVIWPTASISNELYDAWVDERRRLTEEYSGGKLGYLHIRGMNWSSFERFERELMAAGYNKDGIVIDVRYNGGGWTTDYLMAVLNVKQHAYTIPRGAIDNINGDHSSFKNTYPFSERLPLASWTKPSIAMSNENSYSNAEIFSHAYKALGLGKLVGRPTFGAVISTGAHRLVDGSIVRMPFRGWWVKATGDNMERVPAMPDIEVFNPPAYKAKGVDPQLKRAVEELLKEI